LQLLKFEQLPTPSGMANVRTAVADRCEFFGSGLPAGVAKPAFQLMYPESTQWSRVSPQYVVDKPTKPQDVAPLVQLLTKPHLYR
jgi:hypothetical protein